MDPEQIPQLIAQIALADPRVKRDDPKERRAQILMWAGILADVPYDYAVTAAHRHYAKSTWPILPADIATQWAATVRDRMQRDVDPAPPVDPDDEAAYREQLAAHRRAVATGQQPPVEHKALTSGPAAAEAERRIAAFGRYIPPSVDDVLAAYRPRRAARIATIREGRPDALAVPCPVETCRAAVGAACTRPGKGQTRHRLAAPHPFRVDAAAERAA
ncbi:zinc finger domain-containing protein [Streptomyces cyaneofuscatus]|uniref:zinc finger domain-containing protein n=1 Tax=Streptomyces cyaneofuscatus TaxID=66883 RepID=UPI003318490F